MELIIFIAIVALISFFYNTMKFSNKMSDIEIEGYKIFSEQQLVAYRDYLMCNILQKYPNISDNDKVKVVIETIRNAHIGNNKDYLSGFSQTYQYVYLSYLDRIQEIRQILKNEKSLNLTQNFCFSTARNL